MQMVDTDVAAGHCLAYRSSKSKFDIVASFTIQLPLFYQFFSHSRRPECKTKDVLLEMIVFLGYFQLIITGKKKQTTT